MADIDLSFGVQIGGPEDSVKNITDQLNQIIKDIGPLKVQVKVDTEGSAGQWQKDITALTDLQDKSITLKVRKIDTSAALADFKGQLESIVNAISVDKGVNIKVNAPNIGEIQTDLKQVGDAAQNSAADVDKLTAEMKELKLQAASITKAYKELTDTTDTSVNGVEIADLTSKYLQLQAAIEAMNKAGATSSNRHIAEVRQLEAEMRELISTAKKAETGFGPASPENIASLTKVNNLIAEIVKNQREWTKAAKGSTAGSYNMLATYSEQLTDLAKKLSTGDIKFDDFKSQFSAISSGVNTARKQIRAAGEATKSWKDRMGGLVEKFSSWLTVSEVIMGAYRAAQKMVECVVEVDTAMTELKKVTDVTDTTYDRFLTNATDRARNLGATLSDVINASADFARLGHNIDDASKLADAAILYKNVADGIDDISVASASITSTMQAFGVDVADVTSIVDKFNEVSNNYAIDSAGLGDALQRSAAALAAGGNSLDESIALITAANRVIQNPDSVGTTMKTVSMYLRAAKTEAEAAGESTDGMVESTSKLREEILKLTGNKVDIQIDEDTFKSTYQILKELSGVWEKLTDISRANILEKIGGRLLPWRTVMCA